MSKRLCGREVSDIGLGTWGMGGKQSPDPKGDSLHVEAIRYALDKGINVIDTAEMYGNGHTEELVGEAISGYERENLFIISKVWPSNLEHNSVIRSAEQSLKRLGTSYLDLYLIHWPNSSVPILETVSALEELSDRGLVRNIGVSNFSVEEMKGAIDAATKNRICANQIQYNYGARDVEGDIIPFCEKNGIDVIAYTPIMKGKTWHYPRLKDMARKYGVSPVQMALRYTMERTLPIPKSSRKEHIDELVGAAGIKLSSEDYRSLSE